MLFVNNDKPHIFEIHHVFQQGVGADQDLQATVSEGFMKDFPFLLFGGTC